MKKHLGHLFIITMFFSGCKTTDPQNGSLVANDETETIVFNTSTDVIKINEVLTNGQTTSLNTPFEIANDLKKLIEEKFRVRLKDRGEAHVTFTSPAETGALFNGIDRHKVFTPDLIERMKNVKLEASCVGRAFTPNKDNSVYFVVVTSPELREIRYEIKKRAETLKNRAINNFDPEEQHFHITLGFTKKDLFSTPQFPLWKDKRACIENTSLELK